MKIRKSLSLFLILLIIGSITATQFPIYQNKHDDDIQDKENNELDFISSVQTSANNNFSHYKIITIDHTKVNGSENLIDFPVLISIIDSDLYAHAQQDGDDIAFSNGSIWLDHEIELYNPTYSSTEAQLIAWVRIPYLSPSSDTNIYMYYGNSTMETQENPEGVWDSNYMMVQHLHETSETHYDSTSNNNDGTPDGNLDQDITGKIDGADDFDGTDANIEVGDSSSLNITDAITIQAWIKDDLGGKRRILTKGAEMYVLRTNWNGQLHGYLSEGGELFDAKSENNLITTDNYHFVALTWDGLSSDTYLKLFYNGSEISSYSEQESTSSPLDTSDASLFIGSHENDEWWDGEIDEVRISNIARSADWIATEYNNQHDPSSFYKIGNQNNISSFESFTYYKEIIIDHNKVNGSEDLIDFPVLISLVDLELHNHVQPDGDDIAFGINTTLLDHEIEVFNQSYSDTEAQLVSWVRIPCLSSIVDTKINMYYGNSTINSQENPSGVWSDIYRGVWHLNEESGNTKDSTSYGTNGTLSGGVYQGVEGQIDGCYEFDGDSDHVTMGDPSDGHLDFAYDSFTVSFWINFEGSTQKFQLPLYKGGNGVSKPGYEFETNETGNVFDFQISDGPNHFKSYNFSIAYNSWFFVVGVVDRALNLQKIYKNGTHVGNGIDISSLGSVSNSYELSFSEGPYSLYSINGSLDEVRIVGSALSGDWIATEYNNQYDPKSFYSVGTEKNIFNEPTNAFDYYYYKTITIDHTKVFGAECHINFPMLFSITDSDLQDYVQSEDGDDIAFTQGNKWLDHEIELFNRSQAQLIAWVRIPFLSTSIDTNITMYFGNITNINSRENPSGVWDANYMGVWHLKENPDISLPQDSTSNDNDGIEDNLNSSNQVDGIIDGCLSFKESYDYDEMHFNVSHSASLQLDKDITISIWLKTDEDDLDIEAVLTKWGPGSTNENKNYWLGKINDEFRFYVDKTDQYVEIDMNLINDSQWHHIVAVADSSSNLLILYVDGIQQNSNTYGSTLSPGTSILSIGISSGCSDQEWNGLVDEVRISNLVRSVDWIATKYNNTQDPSNFFSLGSVKRVDTTPPSWSCLFESEETLELGDTEIITIDVFDPSGVKQVLIEINELTNYTMEFIGGNTWRNNSWIPPFTGKYNYTIYMEDNHNNWNSTSGDILVEDNTPPSWSSLIYTDPLELGNSENISIEVFDLSEISHVLFEIGGVNYSMVNIAGDTWQNDTWTPSTIGDYSFTVYMNDTQDNWNTTSGSIQVVDTTGPSWSNLVKTDPLEKGVAETISIEVSDLSGVSAVIFEIEGNNYTMVNTVGDTWYNDTWIPSDTGKYNYIIYMNDSYDNWNMSSGDISVIITTDVTPPTWSNLDEITPLELGDAELISIDIFDDFGILEVKFEIEGHNYTMLNITENTWQNNTWIPATTGEYDYTIYIRDVGDNWNNTACGKIQVIDTINPSWSNLKFSADPLELGNVEIITINVTDLSEIKQVLFEIDGVNYSLYHIPGTDMWQNNTWKPTTTGYHYYTIYMEDFNNNWNSTQGRIFVTSTASAPSDGGGGGGGGGSSSSGESDFIPMILVIIGGAVGAIIGIIIFIKKRGSKPRDKELETIESIID
ncbi:MAG: DUF2341 domain-containing protein [Promethearchaeota archaeon]|nr:MAG: DUF2341 domain-containing protein [Candidatus Lokiarchaeota archaeon]